MAHGITSSDGLVLTAKAAWHGLGLVVEQAPTAREALKLARMDWEVQRMPVSSMMIDGSMEVDDEYRQITRSDTGARFGIVGKGYRPVQNHELADFMDAMGSDGSVKIETAGSIRGGSRVWFMARGESVWANDRDEIKTYLLVANGHDGTLAMTCQPTSTRVVCRNTLHLALGRGRMNAVRFKHEGDIASKLHEAKRALGIFDKTREAFADQVKSLVARDMDREALQRFWVDVYSQTVEPIPTNPTTAAERESARDAKATLFTWATNFDRDRQNVGGAPNAWTALNAITEWFDHQKPVRGKDVAARAENRIYANVWGSNAEAKGKALQAALALV